MKTMRLGFLMILGVLAMAMFVVACGSDPTPTPQPKPTATPVPAPTATPTVAAAAAKPKPKATVAPKPKPKPKPTATPKPKAPKVDFKGKTIQFIVGFSPGGGYDMTARLSAKFLSKNLPGNPRIAVKNLTGGGSLRALREVTKSKPNGLTVGQLHPRFATRELLGVDVTGFDLNKVKLVVAPTGGRTMGVYCTYADIAKSWEDVVSKNLKLISGGPEPGGVASTVHWLELIGQGDRVKPLFGYGGSSEVIAAFARRETTLLGECDHKASRSTHPEWYEGKGIIVPLFWQKVAPSEKFLKELGWPGLKVPEVFSLPGVKYDKWQENVMRMKLSPSLSTNRMMMLSENTPDHIVKVWRDAASKAYADKEFQNLLETVGGYPTVPVTAEQQMKDYDVVKSLPPQGIEMLKKLVGAI